MWPKEQRRFKPLLVDLVLTRMVLQTIDAHWMKATIHEQGMACTGY